MSLQTIKYISFGAIGFYSIKPNANLYDETNMGRVSAYTGVCSSYLLMTSSVFHFSHLFKRLAPITYICGLGLQGLVIIGQYKKTN